MISAIASESALRSTAQDEPHERPVTIPRIALALGDTELAMRLGVHLVRAGLSVEMRRPGEMDAANSADVVVFDLDHASADGVRASRRIAPDSRSPWRRPRAATIAVAMTREDGVIARALAVGADDCVAAPVDEQQFVARVRAVLERSWMNRHAVRRLGPIERFGSIEIDVDARSVRRNGQLIALQPKELDLLLALVARRGAAATRQELQAELHAGRPVNPSSRVLDTLICRLRAELEDDPTRPRFLITVPRYGYRLDMDG